MNGSWQMVYDIAARRHETKMGEGHMTPHGLTVLQIFYLLEAQSAMVAALRWR